MFYEPPSQVLHRNSLTGGSSSRRRISNTRPECTPYTTMVLGVSRRRSNHSTTYKTSSFDSSFSNRYDYSDVSSELTISKSSFRSKQSTGSKRPSLLKLVWNERWSEVRERIRISPNECAKVNKSSLDFPLHYAIGKRAPIDVLTLIISAFPPAIQKNSSYGMPLHCAVGVLSGFDVVRLILEEFPEAKFARSIDGAIPFDIAKNLYPDDRSGTKARVLSILKVVGPKDVPNGNNNSTQTEDRAEIIQKARDIVKNKRGVSIQFSFNEIKDLHTKIQNLYESENLPESSESIVCTALAILDRALEFQEIEEAELLSSQKTELIVRAKEIIKFNNVTTHNTDENKALMKALQELYESNTLSESNEVVVCKALFILEQAVDIEM